MVYGVVQGRTSYAGPEESANARVAISDDDSVISCGI